MQPASISICTKYALCIKFFLADFELAKVIPAIVTPPSGGHEAFRLIQRWKNLKMTYNPDTQKLTISDEAELTAIQEYLQAFLQKVTSRMTNGQQEAANQTIAPTSVVAANQSIAPTNGQQEAANQSIAPTNVVATNQSIAPTSGQAITTSSGQAITTSSGQEVASQANTNREETIFVGNLSKGERSCESLAFFPNNVF